MFRKMRRFKQGLSAEKCAEILQTEPRGVLAVLGDGGYPYTVPLDFVYADNKLFFHSAVEGHKVDAVLGNPKASFCVLSQGELSDDGWSFFFDSVVVFGKVTIVDDERERADKLRRLGLKYYPSEVEVDEEIRKDIKRALLLQLEIEHISGKRVHEK